MEINNTLNNSINLELSNTIADDSLIDQFLDNTFITFKSKDEILYLVYSSYNQSIISYNLNSFSIISHIKNAHNKPIINFRYHYYQEENMDLIMSISFDNNIKIWNIIQWKCIINLKKINDSGGILSGCFLHDKNDLYIISSCIYNSEQIKIYNLKGTKLKNIDESNENTYFIDTYYDKRQLKLYIIGGHFNCIKSYDYSNNKLYKKYYESYSNEHCSAIIFQNNDNILLIDSCCGKDKNIRIWNIIQWKCIINLKNINDSGGILSGCFLNDKNDLYIISSCIYNSEQIKIYNLKGKKIKNIDESNENTYFIDTYYDKRQLKLYIIGGHFNCIKSYDYSNNKLYKQYYESYSNEHCSAIIFPSNDNILLIDSCCGKDKNIRIWNFHSAILIEKIFINTIPMGLFLLNEQYLFVGCMDKSIKLIDITEKLEIKYFLGHKTWICTIKVFEHQRLGKCLISQGRRNDNIIIWSIKD